METVLAIIVGAAIFIAITFFVIDFIKSEKRRAEIDKLIYELRISKEAEKNRIEIDNKLWEERLLREIEKREHWTN